MILSQSHCPPTFRERSIEEQLPILEMIILNNCFQPLYCLGQVIVLARQRNDNYDKDGARQAPSLIGPFFISAYINVLIFLIEILKMASQFSCEAMFKISNLRRNSREDRSRKVPFLLHIYVGNCTITNRKLRGSV